MHRGAEFIPQDRAKDQGLAKFHRPVRGGRTGGLKSARRVRAGKRNLFHRTQRPPDAARNPQASLLSPDHAGRDAQCHKEFDFDASGWWNLSRCDE